MCETLKPITKEILSILENNKRSGVQAAEVECAAERADILDEIVIRSMNDWATITKDSESRDRRILSYLSASVVIKAESEYPAQNWEQIVAQIAESSLPEGKPLAPWMFGCLVTDVRGNSDQSKPIVSIVNNPGRRNRLEMIKGRTKDLNNALNKTGIPAQWRCPIADYDIKLLYANILDGEILDAYNIASEYIDRLNSDFNKKLGDNISVVSWNAYQSPLQDKYDTYIEEARGIIDRDIPSTVLEDSISRRRSFFRGLGLTYSADIDLLVEGQLRNQISGYAAEGMLLKKYVKPFSMLVICDRDATRLASYHSLLTGESLPVWFPYKESYEKNK